MITRGGRDRDLTFYSSDEEIAPGHQATMLARSSGASFTLAQPGVSSSDVVGPRAGPDFHQPRLQRAVALPQHQYAARNLGRKP